MLRFAPGQDVQVKVVAQSGSGDNRILFVLVGKLDERVVSLAVDDGALFNPSDLVLLSLNLEKPAAVLKDFKRLSVGHFGDAIGDGGYAVMKRHLARGDVDRLMHLMLKPVASAGGNKKQQNDQRWEGGCEAPDERDDWDWRSREHGRWRSS